MILDPTNPFYIEPAGAVGAFLAGCREALDVRDDGLAPGHSLEVIDVMAALAETVKQLNAAERDLSESLLYRLGCATLDLLSTAFTRTAEDREIAATWRQAYAESLANRNDNDVS